MRILPFADVRNDNQSCLLDNKSVEFDFSAQCTKCGGDAIVSTNPTTRQIQRCFVWARTNQWLISNSVVNDVFSPAHNHIDFSSKDANYLVKPLVSAELSV